MREQNNCFSVLWRTPSKEFQEQKSNKRQHDPEETSSTVVENTCFRVMQIDTSLSESST